MMQLLATASLKTKYGTFTETLFYDGQKEIITLHMGDLTDAEHVYCRLHSSCIYGHYFNSVECDCQEQMDSAMAQIAAAGKGIVVLLDQEGKGNGHLALMKSKAFKIKGMTQGAAYVAAGYQKEGRDFKPAAKALLHFKMRSVALESENKYKKAALEAVGISLV